MSCVDSCNCAWLNLVWDALLVDKWVLNELWWMRNTRIFQNDDSILRCNREVEIIMMCWLNQKKVCEKSEDFCMAQWMMRNNKNRTKMKNLYKKHQFLYLVLCVLHDFMLPGRIGQDGPKIDQGLPKSNHHNSLYYPDSKQSCTIVLCYCIDV